MRYQPKTSLITPLYQTSEQVPVRATDVQEVARSFHSIKERLAFCPPTLCPPAETGRTNRIRLAQVGILQCAQSLNELSR